MSIRAMWSLLGEVTMTLILSTVIYVTHVLFYADIQTKCNINGCKFMVTA